MQFASCNVLMCKQSRCMERGRDVFLLCVGQMGFACLQIERKRGNRNTNRFMFMLVCCFGRLGL